MNQPLNFRQLYGHRHRIVLDESALCEPGGKDDPWYFQIPCRFGHIYPYSDKLLAFYFDGYGVRAKLHRKHRDIETRQWGDTEVVFLFTPEQFPVVAQYAKPKRRRRLSDEHRRKLAVAGRNHRFKSKTTVLRSV